MRALMFFLLVLLLFGLIMMIGKRLELGRRERKKAQRASSEKMVPCAVCGVHVPASTACKAADGYRCAEHCEAPE